MDRRQVKAIPELRSVADVVRQVGNQVLMPRFMHEKRLRKSDGSVLTEADVLAQSALKEKLSMLEDCPLLGEEMPTDVQHEVWEGGSEGVWCVDPIDGTANFANGLAHFAISVAYLRAGRPVLGVIYAPALGEMFCAELGAGVSLNGQPLRTRHSTERIGDAIAEVDFKRLPVQMAIKLAISPPYHSQRNFGSGALSWCYLASGRTDLYLHGGQYLWDFAAGWLILHEACGEMRTFDCSIFWEGDVWRKSVVAARTKGMLSNWWGWLDEV